MSLLHFRVSDNQGNTSAPFSVPLTFHLPPSGGMNPDATHLFVGASGKAWNTLLGGSAPIESKRRAFEAKLGRSMDGSESFPGRKSWDTMSWVDPAFASLSGFRSITLPCQPQGPNKDQDNTVGASGEYNWWWRQYGETLTSLGYDDHRTMLRLNHEPNPSSYAWHPWHMGAGGPRVGPERFRQAVINAAMSVRETAPTVLIVLNLARGNFDTSYTDGATWAEVLDPLMRLEDSHGNPLISAVTSDSYDNSPGVTPHGLNPGETERLSNWRKQTNGIDSDVPPGRNQGFGIPCRGTIYAYCEWWSRERGAPVWFMHPEWGLSHRDDSRGGDDDRFYIELMHDWFSARAVGNGGLMLSESYFNHRGAPDKNKHDILDYGTGQIPAHNAEAGHRYFELWGA